MVYIYIKEVNKRAPFKLNIFPTKSTVFLYIYILHPKKEKEKKRERERQKWGGWKGHTGSLSCNSLSNKKWSIFVKPSSFVAFNWIVNTCTMFQFVYNLVMPIDGRQIHMRVLSSYCLLVRFPNSGLASYLMDHSSNYSLAFKSSNSSNLPLSAAAWRAFRPLLSNNSYISGHAVMIMYITT